MVQDSTSIILRGEDRSINSPPKIVDVKNSSPAQTECIPPENNILPPTLEDLPPNENIEGSLEALKVLRQKCINNP